MRAISSADAELAARHTPRLMLDAAERYATSAIGWTVAHGPMASPSSKFNLDPEGGTMIEYAIWYDWDIGHLYDLEHVWVRLDPSGDVAEVAASFRGQRVPMDIGGGLPRMEGARPVLFAEPGKHAHWSDPGAMALRGGAMIRAACGEKAGQEGVHRGNQFFAAGAYSVTPLSDRLARRKMERDAFVPTFSFTRCSDGAGARLVPWEDLATWIPERVTALMSQLTATVPHLGAVFLDCGDTLIDEATEVKRDGTEVVLKADEIPHAMEAVRRLYADGYTLVLVADGPRETFENLLKHRGIWDLMSAHVISGDVGALKPDARMFAAAMEAVGLDNPARAVMVGNNLARDIRGANDFGLESIFVGWSQRRRQKPAGPQEQATCRIDDLADLPAMVGWIERNLPDGATA